MLLMNSMASTTKLNAAPGKPLQELPGGYDEIPGAGEKVEYLALRQVGQGNMLSTPCS